MSLMSVYTGLLHLLIALGVTVFAVADERPAMALLSVPVVGVAYWARRRAPSFGFSAWVLNTTLIAATLWTLTTATWAIDQTVSEIARYITLIQLIRLFEKPSGRKWAQEIGLSAMLVLGAALTNVALVVGALIFVYCVVLLVTVLAHQVCVGAWRQASRGRGRVVMGRVTRGMRKDFSRVCWAAMAVVVSCTVVVFVLMPRGLGQDMFFGAGLQRSSRTVTDFNDSVTLGERGMINDSSALVMRVELLGEVGEGPYRLRGTTLDTFDPRTSRWARSDSLRESVTEQTTIAMSDGLWDEPEAGTAVTRVSIVQSAASYMFSLAHGRRAAMDGRAEYKVNSQDGTISLNREDLGRGPVYMVLSDLPPRTPPEVATPLDPTLARPFVSTAVPEIASEILDAAEIEVDGSDPTFRVRAIAAFEAHLDEGFGYTLDQVSPPLGTDPLTYFLRERREGHCEYFASALAALCRSVGIAARVVTGYMMYPEGGASGSVRQSNAHAWVEAEMAPGVWAEFDPSPPDGVAAQHQPARGLAGTMRAIMDGVQIAWSKYVVNFDEKKQREALGSASGGPFGGYEDLGRRMDRMQNMPPARMGRMAARSFALGLFAFVGTYGSITLVRLALAWWSRRGGRGEAVARAARGTEIGRVYDGMLAALSKAGLGKPEWRPPVAHAEAIASVDAGVAARAREIAELYYRVAFGGVGLDASDTARAGESLRAMRSDLREVKKRRRRGRDG